MGELSVLDTSDNIAEVIKGVSREELLAFIGQGTGEDTPKTGLSRININYDTDDDEGNSLKKGCWKIYHDGEYVYADKVTFRPLMRRYEWSVYDQETNSFACRSTQEKSLEFQFPDTKGGNKCGRLSKSEEQEYGDDHPLTLASKLAVCNQVFYAVVSMDGKTGSGKSVKIENLPVMAYFKKSSFRPASDAINKIPKNVGMHEQVFELTTQRHKSGSVTFFTPIFTPVSTVKSGNEDLELIGKFAETVNASNNRIMEQHKEALKAKASEQEIDLAAEFN